MWAEQRACGHAACSAGDSCRLHPNNPQVFSHVPGSGSATKRCTSSVLIHWAQIRIQRHTLLGAAACLSCTVLPQTRRQVFLNGLNNFSRAAAPHRQHRLPHKRGRLISVAGLCTTYELHRGPHAQGPVHTSRHSPGAGTARRLAPAYSVQKDQRHGGSVRSTGAVLHACQSRLAGVSCTTLQLPDKTTKWPIHPRLPGLVRCTAKAPMHTRTQNTPP